MGNKIDPSIHIGEQHGIYTIINVLPEKDRYNHYVYQGQCMYCGYIKTAPYGQFVATKTANKCIHVTLTGMPRSVDGTWHNKRIASIFSKMVQRCYNTNATDYRYYGARGIRIDSKWLENPKTFEAWAIDHGYEDNLTIDRIDTNGDYSPGNCRWVTINENAKYKSTTKVLEVDGVAMTGRDWSSYLGLGTNKINTMRRAAGEENTKEFIRRRIDQWSDSDASSTG